jgi:hypothetical protein
MVKKPFTTRLDGAILEMAQAIAEHERRSVTSVIEIAIMDYAAKVEATAGPLRMPSSVADERNAWRIKIHRKDGSRLPDRAFATVEEMIAEAQQIRSDYPDLTPVMTVPKDAEESDREKVRRIGTPLV